jgi:hypothetical protein
MLSAKLWRWDTLRADGIFDQWGSLGELLPNNAIVLQKCEARPGELESWIDKVQTRLDGIRGYLGSLGSRS